MNSIRIVTNPRVRAVYASGKPGRLLKRPYRGWMYCRCLRRRLTRWIELAEKHKVTGADVFDLQLVATMLQNGVRRIYTYNRGDFEVFDELEVVTP